jgi:hypothetical protein
LTDSIINVQLAAKTHYVEKVRGLFMLQGKKLLSEENKLRRWLKSLVMWTVLVVLSNAWFIAAIFFMPEFKMYPALFFVVYLSIWLAIIVWFIMQKKRRACDRFYEKNIHI